MTCLLLFYEFFKTGLFAVGGGLATLPFLYDMAARHPEWFTVSQLADMLAVSESTPGPLGVNMATYVGYLTAGIPFFGEIPVKHNSITVRLSHPYTAERQPPWPSSLGQASRCWRSPESRG